MDTTNKNNLLRSLSVIYLITATFWLLAAFLNRSLLRGPNLLSAYQASGMSYAVWLRAAGVISVLTLGYTAFIARHMLSEKLGKYSLEVIYAGLSLGAIAAIVPLQCTVDTGVCTPDSTLASAVHIGATVLLGCVFLVTSTIVALRYRRLAWMPVMQLLCMIGLFEGRAHFSDILLTVQVLLCLSQVIWLYLLFYHDAWKLDVSEKTASIIRKTLAYFVAFNGVVSVLTAAHIYRVGRRAGGLLFVNDTAWLVQHSVIVGLVLLFLSRSMARGLALARYIVLSLTALEIIKYAAITPRPMDVLGYGILALVLLFSESLFTRRSSPARFINRLKMGLMVILLTATTVVVLSVGFHTFNIATWKRSTLSTTRIVKRTLLLEISSDADDPLRARLFGQMLSAAGIFLYSWLFLGLFLPSLLPHRSIDTPDERKLIDKLLHKYGTSSEDSLKLWPNDKTYWFGQNKHAAVAYKQSGSVSFALAEPISHPARRLSVIEDFRDYCRAQGSHACWLLVSEKNLATYQKAEHKTLAIGASAVVDVQRFASETVKDKWWRWARNKASKQGLRYECLPAPQSDAVLARLQKISDAWLGIDNHSERTFALGYFDTDFLRGCTMHVLRNEVGEIVAFANQLPSYGAISQTTIDLMRFLPEVDGAMALLLSEAILQTQKEGKYTYFDLGFVPLAHVGQQQTTKTLLALSKKALKPVFSMQGLEQFKNKFEPEWEQNYLAWDGDLLDVPMITTSLQKALTLPKK